jgi:ElaB/YqjD/DUF883 family membrane-anchored ribosome-binding protein
VSDQSTSSKDDTSLKDDVQLLLSEFEQLLKTTLRDNTLAAVAVAAAAGFIAGVLLARRK